MSLTLIATPDGSGYEWVPVLHSLCSGQGCAGCNYQGEEEILIRL